MNQTDIEEFVDLDIDFDSEPCCEYTSHGHKGPEDAPVEWAVVITPAPCGCPWPGLRLFCDPCFQVRREGYIMCSQCSSLHNAANTIVRAVRI